MKRCALLLWILCGSCISLHSQMSDMERCFHEKYGVIDVTPCLPETDINRFTSSFNCTLNQISRGREYIPIFMPKETDPTITVRLNLIFVQKNDGTGNFEENNAEHQLFFDDVINSLNRRYSSLVLPDSNCFIGSDTDMIHDTRIRFVDHRYYIRKSMLWNNNLFGSMSQLCPDNNNWYLRELDDSIHQNSYSYNKAINIYFTEDSTLYHKYWVEQNLNDTSDFGNGNTNAACSMFPSYTNWEESSRIHMPCQYSKYWWMKNIVPQKAQFNYSPWATEVRWWHVNSIAMTLAHELGHSFNLRHPNSEHPSSSFYPDIACNASIMYQGGEGPHNFLPPQEIGRMYISMMTTNLQQFIPVGTHLGTKTIDTIVTLPHMHLYHSLEIGSTGNVTMPCDMLMQTGSQIKVLNGGILKIDGASLHSSFNPWRGIIVQSGGTLILSNTYIEDYNITVKSGGVLIIKNNLTISGDHSIEIENGGYLCVENTASIDLINKFSTIAIKGAILGCPSCGEQCISSLNGLTNSGDGQILKYVENGYIQNITITSDTLVTGNVVYGGFDVTPAEPVGNVIVEDGGHLRIRARETILTKDVEVKRGGRLDVYR